MNDEDITVDYQLVARDLQEELSKTTWDRAQFKALAQKLLQDNAQLKQIIASQETPDDIPGE